MKNRIFLLAFSVAVLAGVTACGGGKKKRDGSAEQAVSASRSKGLVISLSDSLLEHRKADTIDFGRVREGEQIVKQFKLKNTGDQAIVIMRVDLSCGCIAAEYPKQPLRPGDEEPMQLTLDTRNLGGWIFKSVVMQTSLAARPYILYVTAEIE